MKTFVTQPYEVTLTDGTTVEVCCAPQMVQKFGSTIKAYKPVGASRRDVCCHVGRVANMTRKQNRELHEHLRKGGFE